MGSSIELGGITIRINDKVERLKKVRDKKGNNLAQFVSDYVIIDIETTGLDTTFDEIIEIGALRVKDNKIIDSFTSLVKPVYEIDEYITELTGITNEMLENAPKIDKVIPKFRQFISNSILVGHNVNFDINFLYDAFMNTLEESLSNDYIDTMRMSRFLLKELKHHRLVDLAYRYGIDSRGSHRSLKDCEITNNCYSYLCEEAIKVYGSLEEFDIRFKRRKSDNNSKLSANDITTENTDFDITHPLYQKVCVFTGTLDKMLRKDAMQIVVDLGGICDDNITSRTNFLILGNNDYSPLVKDGKSNKQKKAEKLKLDGNDIEIISESVFYDIVNV
jgi:DNA polymerase-3 subunit epsilon